MKHTVKLYASDIVKWPEDSIFISVDGFEIKQKYIVLIKSMKCGCKWKCTGKQWHNTELQKLILFYA